MEWIKLRGKGSSYGESVLEKEERKRKGEKKKEEKFSRPRMKKTDRHRLQTWKFSRS